MEIISGGMAIDDRGSVSYVNGFDFKDVKRFYVVANHQKGFVRAWHGHKKEGKYIFVVKGAAIVGRVKVGDWVDTPDDLWTERFVLSDKKPQILYIPAGYAHGFKTLKDDTQVMFFSTSTLEESLNDDYRFAARKWDIWEVTER